MEGKDLVLISGKSALHSPIVYTGCSETSCKFLRLVTQSLFGLFSVFWAFLYYKLWAIFHSSTSGT